MKTLKRKYGIEEINFYLKDEFEMHFKACYGRPMLYESAITLIIFYDISELTARSGKVIDVCHIVINP